MQNFVHFGAKIQKIDFEKKYRNKRNIFGGKIQMRHFLNNFQILGKLEPTNIFTFRTKNIHFLFEQIRNIY